MRLKRRTRAEASPSPSRSPASLRGAALSADAFTEAFLIWCLKQGLYGPIDEHRLIILMQSFAFEEGISAIDPRSFLGALKRAGVLRAWRNLKPYERRYAAGVKRGLKHPRIAYWVLPQRSFKGRRKRDLAELMGQLDLFEDFVPPSEQTAPSRSLIDDTNVTPFQSPPRAAGRPST